jgi:PPOX class probable F420-dependent enzyme
MTPRPALDPVLDGAKYVSFTTFRRDGRPVATAVWIARHGDGYGFTTALDSGKVRRLAHTPRATLRVCDARGRVADGTATWSCTARVVTHDEAVRVRDAIARKYGLTYRLFAAYLWCMERIGRGDDGPETAVVLTLDAG